MASPSSRRKSASKSSPELLEKILADGTQIAPTPEVREVAEYLAAQGIISFETREYVLCANARDAVDFRYVKNRNCRGRIYLQDALDLHGDDYKCPDCDRPIFPAKKVRYDELHIRVQPEGVRSYVESALKQAEVSWKVIAPWLYRVDVGSDEVWLCVVDFCDSQQQMTREWAVAHQNRVLWLVVHPRGRMERFLKEDWVSVVSLAELLGGQADLQGRLEAQAQSGPTATLGNPSRPIYSKAGRHPETYAAEAPSHPDRLFVVQVADGIVFVNGLSVVPKQAGTGYPIFKILLRRHLQGMLENIPSGDYRPLSIGEICNALYEMNGKAYDDEDAVRKTINRIQGEHRKSHQARDRDAD